MSDGETTATPDWGRMRFENRPFRRHAVNDDPGATRFTIGLATFLVVALVYPWYSYWVQSRLLASDVIAGIEEVQAEADQAGRAMKAEFASSAARQRENATRERIRAVSVRGFSEHTGFVVAIVDLGTATLDEATPAICLQVLRWRGTGTYEPIQVRRFRRNSPAVTVGTIQCQQ